MNKEKILIIGIIIAVAVFLIYSQKKEKDKKEETEKLKNDLAAFEAAQSTATATVPATVSTNISDKANDYVETIYLGSRGYFKRTKSNPNMWYAINESMIDNLIEERSFYVALGTINTTAGKFSFSLYTDEWIPVIEGVKR